MKSTGIAAKKMPKSGATKVKIVIPKELITFVKIFAEGRRFEETLPENPAALASVLLPALSSILREDAKQKGLAKYIVYNTHYDEHTDGDVDPEGRQRVREGMILGTNEMSLHADHWRWVFFEVTKITDAGNISGREIGKRRLATQSIMAWDDPLRNPVEPVKSEGEGRRKTLKGGLYWVFTPGISKWHDGTFASFD
jgi:hypothetical protein